MANDGKTYLTFHRAFAANSTATFTDKEGVLRPLIRVSIPSGTVLGGRDIGGASFLARYAYPSRYNANEVSFSFLPEQAVALSIPERDEEGNVTGYESIRVSAEALKVAVDAERRAWREAHPAPAKEKPAVVQESVDMLDEIDAMERMDADGMLEEVPAERNPLEDLDS